MKVLKKQYWMFFISMFILLLILNIHFVNAADELFLTGIVRSVDQKSRIAIVEVKSEGCRGVRSFIVDDVSELEGLTGKKISFFIDSSICKSGEIYKMHKITLSKSKGKRL